MEINKKYSAIVLSAGKSSRMGTPKFTLRYNDKTTFLEHIINEYILFGCEEIVVVVNQEGQSLLKELKFNFHDLVKIIVNPHPEWERFYSLKLGALAINTINPVFISNVDNPFVEQELLRILSDNSNEGDYISPVFNGRGGHPFLLSKNVVLDIRSEEKDQIHLKDFLGKYSKKSVEVDNNRILLNINTTEEYKKYFK